jgi:hypothetical protein
MPEGDPEITLSPAERRFREEMLSLHSAPLPDGLGELEKLAQGVVEALARYKLDR